MRQGSPMFELLRSLWRHKHSTPKEFVSFDELRVTWHRPDGTTEEVSWDELSAAEIVTTDARPFVCDVYFVLHGNDRRCVVPHEAQGCKGLLERLLKLPGFNNQAVIDAMFCTSNARFSLWQRENAPAS
jgi:hypothetical protein